MIVFLFYLKFRFTAGRRYEELEGHPYTEFLPMEKSIVLLCLRSISEVRETI
ncbi:hypothetical protein [Leptospira noguchii]|uniref:hypothetical protein n=1 Tax=Leptospira noguchii TaxID=28182 RepID=UPI0002E6FDC9|nr:hypothetical protein [Leptospira noguchii]